MGLGGIGPSGSGSGGAPTDASYVTVSANATLTAERVITAGDGVTLTDGGANSTITIDVPGTQGPLLELTLSGDLPNARQVTAGTGIAFTDNGALSTFVIKLGAGAVQIASIQRPGTNITGTGFKTVASFTLTGGLLGTGNLLEMIWILRQTTGSGALTNRLSYGGSVIATQASAQALTISRAYLWNTGASNSQRGVVCTESANSYGAGTGAIDSSVDKTVLIELDLATDTDVFVCDYFYAKLMRQT